MAQMKDQIKTPEKELNEMEIRNLLDAEFKTLFIGMLKELSESLSSIKKDPVRNEGSLIEIKNNLQGNNSRVDKTKNQINDLEHKKGKRIKKTKYSVSGFWDNFEHSNMHTVGVPEGKEKEQEIGNLFEKIVKENFPTLVKEIDMQVHK